MIIERFDGDHAVVRDGDDIISIHRSYLPHGADAGDYISINSGHYELEQKSGLSAEVRDKLREMLGGSND